MDKKMDKNKKSRKDQAEETKRHIFHTALKLLDEQGYEKIKIRDIVQAANVSIGAFYHYYNSKMDVFYETYHLADEYFEETVLPLLVQESAKERIHCFFDHYARYCYEITSLALTSILYNSNNKCFERTTDRGILRVLTEQMNYGLSRQELRRGDSPEFMARFFIISVRGLVYNWCIHEGSYDLKEAASQHVERLLQCYSTSLPAH
jgi:AcrR family transcriptional regulator